MKEMSNSQLYKQAGNSIVVQVAEAILKELHGDYKGEIKHFELFAGIGAFSKAYNNLGYNHKLIGYSEFDKYAANSFSRIHGVSEDLNLGDITKINRIDEDVDVLTGGFPCQDISVAGKGKGIIAGETRSGLMFDMLIVTQINKPKVVIAENVKNLLSKKHKPQMDLYIEEMDRMGYNTTYKVLNSKDFGMPQNRERVFIVSIRKDLKDYINFNFDNLETRKMESIETIVEFENVERTIKKIAQATKIGFIELETPAVANLSFPNSKTRRGRVIDNGKVSPTLQTSCEIYAVEDKGSRKISPLECFKLMGFTEEDYLKVKGEKC